MSVRDDCGSPRPAEVSNRAVEEAIIICVNSVVVGSPMSKTGVAQRLRLMAAQLVSKAAELEREAGHRVANASSC